MLQLWEKKNPGSLGCLRIATSHQCVTALKNTQKGLRPSSSFQGRVIDLGFSSLPPCFQQPSLELLLWDSTESCYVPLANNLLADSSWYSVIVQWLFICFVPVCPFIGTHQPHDWEAATSKPISWVREALVPSTPLSVAHARANQHFGTNSVLWDPGNEQLPESVTGTCGLTQLPQAEEVQVIFRLLLQDWCSMAAVTLLAPSSPTERVAVVGMLSPCLPALGTTQPELVLTASQLQHTPKGLAWTAPAVFMDVPLPWSKPGPFPQPSSAVERLRLFFINTLKWCLQFLAHTVCYSIATPMSTVWLECRWSVQASMSKVGSWSSFIHVNV